MKIIFSILTAALVAALLTWPVKHADSNTLRGEMCVIKKGSDKCIEFKPMTYPDGTRLLS